MTPFKSPAEIDEYLNLNKHRIVSRECKHATYSQHRNGERSDMLSIKEYVTLDDGTRWPRMRFVENYPRPYWVTKPHFRTHPDKIQFEHLDRVDMFKSPQCRLRQDICFRLGYGDPRLPIKQLAQSQYLYGLDPGAEVFMKQSYMNKWPNNFLPNRVTVVDAETDVNGVLHTSKNLPILWSLVSDDEIVLYVNKTWASDIPNFAQQAMDEYQQVIGQWTQMIRTTLTEKKGKNKGKYPDWVDLIERIPVRVEELVDDYAITEGMINRLHETQPDIVTGWNVFFDATVMVNSIENAGRDPADVMSDPRAPYVYRGCRLTEGPHVKKTASDREMRLDPQERWNVVLNTASWRVMDAMQVYWQLRKAKGKESGGYGLDAVLGRQLKTGKLKYDTEDSDIPPNTLHWHMEMQHKYKVRYGVYNIIDSLGVWVLDKKNSDMSSQVSTLSGPTDYSNFNSQPRVNATDMLFSVLKKRGKVLCSTSNEMKDDNDKRISLGAQDGWIVTFPSHNVVDTGVYLFHDMPNVQSMIHMFNADADLETTYPTSEIILNLSKETTVAEPCRVKGVGKETLRLAAINMTGGRVNAQEIIQTVCKMPRLDEWVEHAKLNMIVADEA